MELGIRVTPKIHALFVHVKQFCSKNKLPLGAFSEQASESVHANFKTVWKHFTVDINHSEFGSRLLSAVACTLDENNCHIGKSIKKGYLKRKVVQNKNTLSRICINLAE